MKVEINEETISEYANQRMKQLVDQKVKERLAEIQWYKTVDHAVYDVVRENITSTIIREVVDNIDRKMLLAEIGKSVAELMVDKMYGE